jgi:hypothetical protein
MASYAEKIAAGRLPCAIPGCQRTFKPEGSTEIICGAHWKLAPAHKRRRVALLRTRHRRLCGDGGFWQFPAGSPKRLEGARLERMFRAAWAACKKAAIDRAMGI